MLQDYISFLHELSLNNNKIWFDKHKDRYLKLQKEYEHFVDEMIVEIHKIDNSVQFLTRRESMFRIYRDARFGRDKTPYKTWVSCAFSPNGKKADEPGYFFRLNGDGQLTVGGGLWTPESAKLAIVRKNLSADSKNLERVLINKDIIKQYGIIQDNKVSRPPRGFHKEDLNIELIKQKSWVLIDTLGFEGDYDKLKNILIQKYTILYPFIFTLRDYMLERYD
jgi:uncharacterized protein (TIGR02453 family)